MGAAIHCCLHFYESDKLLEFYPHIRNVHIWAVSLSGLLFLLRSISSIIGAKWPHLFAVRILSYLIDTTLLTAAAMLWTILPREVFASGWLNLKLAMVVVYIGFGFVAMRQNNKRNLRIVFLLFAAIIYCVIIGIARAHNMAGWFALFPI